MYSKKTIQQDVMQFDSYRRSDNIGGINIVDRPDSANVTWFRSKDYDRSGAISFQVSWILLK